MRRTATRLPHKTICYIEAGAIALPEEGIWLTVTMADPVQGLMVDNRISRLLEKLRERYPQVRWHVQTTEGLQRFFLDECNERMNKEFKRWSEHEKRNAHLKRNR